MSTAIFDVDRTLLDGMSGYLFTRWLWTKGHLSARSKLRIAKSFFLYRSGLKPLTELVAVGVTCLAGMHAVHVDELADQCVNEVLWPLLFTEAVEKIAEHAACNDFTCLASGSAQPLIAALARRVGADAGIGTAAMIDENGLYLPKVKPPFSYMAGKLELVEQLLREKSLRLDEAALYTDNDADLPLCRRVARPFAVNPDPGLKQKALEHEWPILTWETRQNPKDRYTGTSWPIKS